MTPPRGGVRGGGRAARLARRRSPTCSQGQGDVDVWARSSIAATSLDDALFIDIRLPRAVAGVIAGGALAGAAVVLQAITRNPLAEPATLGLTAGGALTVTLVAAYASLAPGAPTIAVAFVGVAAGTLLIGAMAAAGGGGIRLILAGMAVGLALAAATGGGAARARDRDERAVPVGRRDPAADRLGAGARGGADRRCPRVLGVFALSRALDVAVLGESTARALGCAPG